MHAVHVVAGAELGHGHGAGVATAGSGAIHALAEIGNLVGSRRILPGVPGVDERVAGDLRELMADDAHHAVHAHVVVGALERRHGSGHELRDGEWVRARLRARLARVADPRVRQRVAHFGREGEIVESAHRSAVVLHHHVLACEHHVQPALGVHWQRAFVLRQRAVDDVLHREAGQHLAVRVVAVVVLGRHHDGRADVGARLVRVGLHRGPPLLHRRAGDGRRRGDRAQEVADDAFLGVFPGAVPDDVDLDGGREHRPHVVLHVHQGLLHQHFGVLLCASCVVLPWPERPVHGSGSMGTLCGVVGDVVNCCASGRYADPHGCDKGCRDPEASGAQARH